MPNYPPQGNLSPTIVIGEIDDATLVIESEGIASNDNDTTFATSAAVKDYSDTTSISNVLTDGNILIGNGSNVATSVNPTGDIDISNTGVFSIAANVIVDGDLSAGAFPNITGVGTIASGTWEGTVVASGFLDADTAHLAVAQTFTADKNFNGANLNIEDSDIINFGDSSNVSISFEPSGDPIGLQILHNAASNDQTHIVVGDGQNIFRLESGHTSPADGTNINQISMVDLSSTGVKRVFSRILTTYQDPTNTTEEIEMGFFVMESGTLREYLKLNNAGDNNVTFFRDISLDDNIQALFGTGEDASINYDGTNLIITPDLVGTGIFRVAQDSNTVDVPTLTGAREFVVTGEANQITNTEITSGVFAKITGVGAQSQTFDAGTNLIDNVSDIATGTISDETNTVSVITITDTSGLITVNQNVTFDDAVDLAFNATTGTKIGTATSQKLSFYNSTPIVQPTALTTVETSLTFVNENTPDFALASLKLHSDDTGAGFADIDEAQAFVEVVANMQIRVGEIETKLQALGLLA